MRYVVGSKVASGAWSEVREQGREGGSRSGCRIRMDKLKARSRMSIFGG